MGVNVGLLVRSVGGCLDHWGFRAGRCVPAAAAAAAKTHHLRLDGVRLEGGEGGAEVLFVCGVYLSSGGLVSPCGWVWSMPAPNTVLQSRLVPERPSKPQSTPRPTTSTDLLDLALEARNERLHLRIHRLAAPKAAQHGHLVDCVVVSVTCDVGGDVDTS
jgi:hypothetical protein